MFADERTFALGMAERECAAFALHLAAQAALFSSVKVLTENSAVADGWTRFFDAPAAPFSTELDPMEVLADGTRALSTGPVCKPVGQPTARFNSVWRLEAPDMWRILFAEGEASGKAELYQSLPSPVTNQRALQKADA